MKMLRSQRVPERRLLVAKLREVQVVQGLCEPSNVSVAEPIAFAALVPITVAYALQPVGYLAERTTVQRRVRNRQWKGHDLHLKPACQKHEEWP